MGCDIHMYSEVRVKDKWYSADNFIVNTDYSAEDTDLPNNLHKIPKTESTESFIIERVSFYKQRDYKLFTVLNDVRNYKGFTDFIKLSHGIPDDASNIVKSSFNYWGCDAHSEAYATFDELTVYYEHAKLMLVKQEILDNSESIMYYQAYIDFYNTFLEHAKKYCRNTYDYNFKTLSDFRIIFWFDN